MYQNPNNKTLSAGGEKGGGGSNGTTTNNVTPQITDPIQQSNPQQQSINYNGMQPQQQTSVNTNKSVPRKPYVRIIEQPASKALRFRYECEGRSAGSIPGVNSTPECKTYPTIEVVGYKGRAVVVVSCVTKDQPYRPHPHNIVGKEGCTKGVCTLEINSETMRAVFSNLGIQCVKKKDIKAALKAREEIRVDPYRTGFAHRNQPSSIDLNSVRLCFQVIMWSEGSFKHALAPVVSEPIFDKKAMSDLVICRLCSSSSGVLGNAQIMLLCEKVAKEDISVRFYEDNNGQIIWEAYGDFQHTDVHKQTAITFKTPQYWKIDITEPVKVFIQLKRPSDGVTSEPLPFEYIPLESDPAYLKRKRQKTNGNPVHLLLKQQQDGRLTNLTGWNLSHVPTIKTEPRDTSAQTFGIYRAPSELTPSPQPLSPSNIYTHNTPSSYNMATQGNQQFISPNHQYNTNNLGQSMGNNINPNVVTQINIGDYNAFSQETQPQQQYNNLAIAGATHWETKFNPVTAATNHNLDNLTNANTYTLHNLLTPARAEVGQVNDANGNGNNLNLTSNQFDTQQHHLQQQYQQQTTPNNVMTIANNTAAAVTNILNVTNENNNNNNDNNNTNNNNNKYGLSNLLTIDSGQLVRIDSEDQQMLQLNSEDLQISNLSIST